VRKNIVVGLKYLNPVTPSSRGVVLIDKSKLWKGKPEASLAVRIKNRSGRNNRGVITVQGRGGGSKKIYRIIDFKRKREDIATVERIEYDPNRTAFIALVIYEDGEKSYILAPDGVKPGQQVSSKPDADILPGNCLKLDAIPIGTLVHNIELLPGKGGQLARSAGNCASLTGKEKGYALLKLPSGEIRKVPLECKATIGILSNLNLVNEVLGKAGRNRVRGRRPMNRGRARNPVDHHNGGRSCGKVLANFNGRVVKGKKTRKKPVSKLVIKRRG